MQKVFTEGNQLSAFVRPSHMVERRRSRSDRSLNKNVNGNEDNGHNDGVWYCQRRWGRA